MEQSNNAPTETRLIIGDGNEKSQVKTPEEFIHLLFSIQVQRIGRWDVMFVLSCLIGFVIDPLFLYIWRIDDHIKCVRTDLALGTLFVCLRFVVDSVYFLDYLRVLRFTRVTRFTKACNNTHWGLPRLITCELLRFILAINLSAPYPQVLLMKAINLFYVSSFFLPLIAVQYATRVSYIYKWIKRIDINTSIGMFIKGVLLFIPFVLAAHLFGAMWYYFAINREAQCWAKVCHDGKRCYSRDTYGFYCKISNVSAILKNNVTVINTYCPTNPSNPKVFNFGIYVDVIDSGMSRTTDIATKLVPCFWWGLRNLSSFGSNLQPGPYVGENAFGISISITGIILFLIYLNKNLETFRQVEVEISRKRGFDRKMQMINPEIDLWLSKNSDVPKDMKRVIMESVRQRVEEDKDVNVEDILSILPLKDKRRIMQPAYLASLKKVPMLRNMDEQVLEAMSGHLKLVTYTEEICIIREREPIQKILFITRGSVLTYKSSNTNAGEGLSTGSSMIECLQKDDCCGAELLIWAFNFGSFSDLPISTSTVVCQEKVQAFSIRAKDLKSVVSRFWWLFSCKLHYTEDSLLIKELEPLATSSLQAAWRRHKAKKNCRIGWHTIELREFTGLK